MTVGKTTTKMEDNDGYGGSAQTYDPGVDPNGGSEMTTPEYDGALGDNKSSGGSAGGSNLEKIAEPEGPGFIGSTEGQGSVNNLDTPPPAVSDSGAGDAAGVATLDDAAQASSDEGLKETLETMQ